MSAGTTYSRTTGKRILPGTWQAVMARHPKQFLRPHERLSWDDATVDAQQACIRLAAEPLTQPPDFLRFDLARGAYAAGQYPGSVPIMQGRPADGHLLGQTPDAACALLGISVAQLAGELGKFSGPVSVIKLMAGQTIYRSVGLTAKSANHGSVTNRLMGDYWEPACPDTYADVNVWRQATAVLAEWNGDHGYVALTLEKDLVVLAGQVGMQVVDVAGGMALPGGGQQYFVPNIKQQLGALAARMEAIPLKTLIQETLFASVRVDKS